ncbi:hypothetical protein Dxin01_02874 [Deinococcus xinjiangensis]|uniref:Uncharacterized protein n=1 Tax=Deinococcus xinjiangensis TaxID=457454 RepID=A0ABP9VEY5_9DEIO
MTDLKDKRHFDETGDWLIPPAVITPDGLEKPLTDPNTYADGGTKSESDD